jgi:hypothetical protein
MAKNTNSGPFGWFDELVAKMGENIFKFLLIVLAAAFIVYLSAVLIANTLNTLNEVVGIAGLMIFTLVVGLGIGFYLGKRNP